MKRSMLALPLLFFCMILCVPSLSLARETNSALCPNGHRQPQTTGSLDELMYGYDENEHWKICAECKEPMGKEVHEASGIQVSSDYMGHYEGCFCGYGSENMQPHEGVYGQVCSVCGYMVPLCIECNEFWPRMYWQRIIENGQERHIYACAHGKSDGQALPHSPDYSSDEMVTMGKEGHAVKCLHCNLGNGEVIPHQGEVQLGVTGTYHVYFCELCSQAADKCAQIPHTPGTKMRPYREGTHAIACTECNAGIDGTEAPCVFGDEYSAWGPDQNYHYPMCSMCGACNENGKQPHTYDTYTYMNDESHAPTCSVCFSRAGESIPHTPSGSYTYYSSVSCQYYCEDCACYVSVNHDLDPATIQETADGMRRGVCRLCGEEGREGVHIHYFHSTAAAIDNRLIHQRLLICECGEERIELEPHSSSCKNPDACHMADCDQEDPIIRPENLDHYGNLWMAEGDMHYMVCTQCGQRFNEGLHTIPNCLDSANSPCSTCGKKYDGDNFIHKLRDYEIDAEGNEWIVCACKKQQKLQASYLHGLYCGMPEMGCILCGDENCQPEYLYHGYLLGECNPIIAYDDQTHTYTCEICGDVLTEPHSFDCMLAGACSCGWIWPQRTAANHRSRTWEGNEQEHWSYCDACELPFDLGTHTPSAADPGICAECGLPCA